VYPFVRLRTGDFTLRQTTLKTSPNKMVKHQKTYYDNQYAFIQFEFDTFDFLILEIVDLLKKVQMIMHDNVVSLKSIDTKN
jgi:hypothetical protein